MNMIIHNKKNLYNIKILVLLKILPQIHSSKNNKPYNNKLALNYHKSSSNKLVLNYLKNLKENPLPLIKK